MRELEPVGPQSLWMSGAWSVCAIVGWSRPTVCATNPTYSAMSGEVSEGFGSRFGDPLPAAQREAAVR